ncbi:site-specific integrase [uncultured Brevundimonas sp.]|uniref:tyrosine-type recombinase/integrase n=1 Tax=uncultured Brevundimonas sp. TaxID=213418 RepID=UPI0026215ECE|nr:site-specific integrase [uncultured Brevundimonas sp.]
MARVRLKGLNQVSKRLADGRRVTYWYAWKGGPRLPGAPGSPAFMAAYNDAVGQRRAPSTDDLAALVALYRSSPEFQGLGASTRAEWNRWLDRIADRDGDELAIGGLPYPALDDRRVRADILAWRDQWADRPRSADYAIQVLGRVLAWGLDRGLLALNAAAGIGQLYTSNRADQVWTANEIARVTAAAKSPEVGYIIRLACLTGLRRDDLAGLMWSHVGQLAIVKPTGKSRGRKVATIPLLDETLALLDEIRAQQVKRHAELCAVAARKNRPAPPAPLTVLTNTRGRPWTVNGLEHQIIDAKAAASPPVSKHLHDARGTFATYLRQGGLTAPEIADVLGWEEKRVERLLATYVDRDSIVMDLAQRLRRNKSGTQTPN